MAEARGRTRLSSRGQVVIPKEVREQLKLEAGQDLSVFTDGPVIYLVPVEHTAVHPSTPEATPNRVVRERRATYQRTGDKTVYAGAPTAAELVRRVKAVSRLRQLRGKLAGRRIDWDALWEQTQADRR